MADITRLAREAAAKRGKKKKQAVNPIKPALISCGAVVVCGAWLYKGSPTGLKDQTVNDASMIDVINRDALGWTAKAHSVFDGWTGDTINKWGPNTFEMGGGKDWHYCNPEMAPVEGDVPDSFDAREKWPDCFTGHIYDQGKCSGSWAIASVSMLANRYCIQDPEEYKQLALSPQSLLSCNVEQNGCDGGSFSEVWNYLQTDGVVSETCFPFQGAGVSCGDQCEETPKKLAEGGKCVADSVESLKRELMANGPVVVPVRLVDELLIYSSGVFLPTATAKFFKLQGDNTDGKRGWFTKLHLVKIVGWGFELGTEYWIIENSWGTEWGEDGYAKMAALPFESPDASAPEDQKKVLLTNMPIVAYPANMKTPGKGAPDTFDDSMGDEDGSDELTFDDGDGLDDEVFGDDALGDVTEE